jgi:hypothetical protein
MEIIYLKWGTLKGWINLSESSVAILNEYSDLGMSLSALLRRDTPEQKQLLIKLLKQLNGKIINDWTDKEMTVDEAVKYIEEAAGRYHVAFVTSSLKSRNDMIYGCHIPRQRIVASVWIKRMVTSLLTTPITYFSSGNPQSLTPGRCRSVRPNPRRHRN